jgi:hypothetical protein
VSVLQEVCSGLVHIIASTGPASRVVGMPPQRALAKVLAASGQSDCCVQLQPPSAHRNHAQLDMPQPA